MLLEHAPALVVVPGDVNSTLAGALAAVKLDIPVAHLEAGLRSFDPKMPEEHNRRVTDHLSAVLLAHSQSAVENLAAEGIAGASVHLVGNTMIDSVLEHLDAARDARPWAAIGGLAKGHLAREVDALGGEMGKATDMTGLQFRMLNRKKGPAVWAPRAQCDKKAYQFRMKWICEKQENLDLRQAQCSELLHRDGRVSGVQTNLDVRYIAKAVIVTTGTFLNGLMHIGQSQQSGGRAGETAATGISASLMEIGLELGRLKTGTPPRLLRRSIDFSKTEVQPGDYPVPYFTYWKDDLFHVEHPGCIRGDAPSTTSQDSMFHVEQPRISPVGSILERIGGQLPCHITYTTRRTADLINANLHKSPLYSGIIRGVGPRYCPSIEDKIVRFSDKDRHQIFLEPEGICTDEIYVNGFSTSLPFEVQVELVRTIIGCERAEILRPAYAVEYDFCASDPALSITRNQGLRESLSGGPDQWNLRIRRGGSSRSHGRD